MTDKTTTPNDTSFVRYLVIAVLVLGAFFGAYRFAAARGASAQPSATASTGLVTAGNTASSSGSASGSSGSASSAGCACCGTTAPTDGGVTGTKVEGRAAVAGDVQKIDVDLSKGYYEPNQIVLKAGVPAEITFGQSSGCTAQVISSDLGFSEDLTAGPRTVELPALEKGEYAFSCGMEMVYGKIVVE